MISATVEDYLRQIHLAEPPGGAGYVSMKELARTMQVAPGTATAMARSLARDGLVVYALRKGVRLTAEGRAEARRVLRRHRLIELFLVKVLGQDWADVHEDAHRLEHAVSQRVEEAMDRVLGHPAVDPHGDPIPGGGGTPGGVSLAEAADGSAARVTRIEDQGPEFLRYAARTGLVPGAEVLLRSQDRSAGTARLKVGSRELTLALSVLAKIRVEPRKADHRPRPGRGPAGSRPSRKPG